MDADGHQDLVFATNNNGLQVIRQGPARPDPPPPPSARTIDDACPEGQVPPSSLNDVPSGSAHARPIDCLLWWKVASGRADGTFAPADGVTREAMATYVARTILAVRPTGWLPEQPPDAFTDDNGSAHQLAINQLASIGLVGGTGDGKYDPAAVLNRGQMARFLSNAASYVLAQRLPIGPDKFDDDNASPFEDDINRIAEAGITGGLPDGTYGASGEVTRGQMASFLARTLDLCAEHGAPLPS